MLASLHIASKSVVTIAEENQHHGIVLRFFGRVPSAFLVYPPYVHSPKWVVWSLVVWFVPAVLEMETTSKNRNVGKHNTLRATNMATDRGPLEEELDLSGTLCHDSGRKG